MIVFGTLKTEEVGKELFHGNMEECTRFIAEEIAKTNFYDLHICEDNGEIIERVI